MSVLPFVWLTVSFPPCVHRSSLPIHTDAICLEALSTYLPVCLLYIYSLLPTYLHTRPIIVGNRLENLSNRYSHLGSFRRSLQLPWSRKTYLSTSLLFRPPTYNTCYLHKHRDLFQFYLQLSYLSWLDTIHIHQYDLRAHVAQEEWLHGIVPAVMVNNESKWTRLLLTFSFSLSSKTGILRVLLIKADQVSSVYSCTTCEGTGVKWYPCPSCPPTITTRSPTSSGNGSTGSRA